MKIRVLIFPPYFLPSLLPDRFTSRSVSHGLRIYPSSPFCWPGTCVYVVLWLLIYILTACICVFCWCVFFICVYVHTAGCMCVLLCQCVCVANRSYWLVVKPRSLRVFMSGKRSSSVAFSRRWSRTTLSTLSLRSDSLCWAKRHVSQSSLHFPVFLTIRSYLTNPYGGLLMTKVLNEHRDEL